MKNKKLLILLLPALMLSLASCNGNNNNKPSSGDSSQSQTIAVTAVAINKATLELEPGESENLTASVTPENASDTSVTWSSSDETIATVSALGKVSALKEGTCKIIATSVSNPDVKGECALTVKLLTAKELYGAAHKGTEDDPLTNEDAILVAKHKDVGEKATTKKFYIKGEVDYFTEVPSSYGNVSFTFKPAAGKTERFVAYRVKKGVKGDPVTYDDVWKGGQATIYASIYNYKGEIPEVKEGYFVKTEGEKVAPQTITGKTVAQALATIASMNDNEVSFDKYEVTGYISKVTDAAGTFFMADEKGEAETVTGTNFEVYGYSGELKNQCTLNAKVKVTCTLKKYVSTTDSSKNQYETGSVDAVEILEAGDKAAIIQAGAPALTAVAKDTEYFAGVNQATINKNCFVTGEASGSYLATGAYSAAKPVVLKEATGGYNLQFKESGKYVNKDSSNKLVLGDEAATVYTWDTVTNSLKTPGTITNKDGTTTDTFFYICAYSTYDTLGFSQESYLIANGTLKEGQFPIQFYNKAELVAATEVQVDSQIKLREFRSTKLAFRFNPYNADVSSLTWTSSDPTIATVSSAGVVEALKKGQTTITAKVGTLSDEVLVTVTEDEPVAYYSLLLLNSKNTDYTKTYDTTMSDGQIWNIPGNQNQKLGVKIGGKLSEATNRALYTKNNYGNVYSITVKHGAKDKQITVNSLTLYVYDDAAKCAKGNAADAVETVVGTFAEKDETRFVPAGTGPWNRKYFRIVYNLSSSAASSNYGVMVSSMTIVQKEIHEHTWTDGDKVAKTDTVSAYTPGTCSGGEKRLVIDVASDLNGKITARGGKLAADNDTAKYVFPMTEAKEATIYFKATVDNDGNFGYNYYTGKNGGSSAVTLPDGKTNTTVKVNDETITLPKTLYKNFGIVGTSEEWTAGTFEVATVQLKAENNEITLTRNDSYGLSYWDIIVVYR